jgi:hypothetical protein
MDSKYQVTESLEVHGSGVLGVARSYMCEHMRCKEDTQLILNV